MTRPTYVATIPKELRAEIAGDIESGSQPQLLVVVGEGTVTVATRPSSNATWGPPVLAELVAS